MAVVTTAPITWPRLKRITPRTVWHVLLAGAAVALALYQAQTLFVLFAGVLVALYFKTFAEIAVRHVHLPYRIAVVLLMLLHIGVLGGVVISAGPSIAAQAVTLVHLLPAALQHAIDAARRTLGDGAFAVPSVQELRPAAKSVVAGAQGVFTGSVALVAGLVVMGFVGLYGALGPDAYARVVLAVVPELRKRRAGEVLHETGRRLGRWLIGRAVAMAFVAVATSIGLYALHVPLAIALGVLAGLLTFVEYIGAISSAIPPVLIALGQSPGRAVGVVLLFLGVHIIEGYVLTPLLDRRTVRFPPAYTLAAQTFFGALFGVLGITFATPTCIVIVTLVEMLYVQDTLGKVSEPSPPGRAGSRAASARGV